MTFGNNVACIVNTFVVSLQIIVTINVLQEVIKILHEEMFNPLPTNVPHHIETSQLICNANQLTSFYMMGNIGR